MKAITIRQPYASLIALGEKRIETRCWSTPYRGPLAIHAAKEWPQDELADALDNPIICAALKRHDIGMMDLPLGAVIATARLIGVEPTHLLTQGVLDQCPPDEFWFGDFSVDRYAWMLSDVVMLPEPIRCRGAIGLWDWETAQGVLL